MLEHEVDTTASVETAKTRAGAVKYRRSTSLLLAIITLLLFICALIFLIVSLIIPIFHGMDVHGVSNASHATDADHHHHGHK